ncbi:MAG TPA: selenide, water dikinase SelD, partial [Alcaligenaceae bacterium]|nr:selenide, water dikinase SelD [Alcaligenaceae bacterium]
WLPNVPELAAQGFITGASARNWQAYGEHITLDPAVTETQRGMLTDPQTSGGLLVSCSADVADQVLALFHEQGFEYARVIGQVTEGKAGVTVK